MSKADSRKGASFGDPPEDLVRLANDLKAVQAELRNTAVMRSDEQVAVQVTMLGDFRVTRVTVDPALCRDAEAAKTIAAAIRTACNEARIAVYEMQRERFGTMVQTLEMPAQEPDAEEGDSAAGDHAASTPESQAS